MAASRAFKRDGTRAVLSAMDLDDREEDDATRETAPKKRGFAAMSPEARRAAASRGGKTAHARGTANRFSSEQARAAGSRGGRRVAQDPSHMAQIGRAGGLEAARARAAKRAR